jgi:four helix bundle protein
MRGNGDGDLGRGSILPSVTSPAPKIRDYRDLIVWQKAMEFALLCDDICDTLDGRLAHIVPQLRKASNSVHANIAEGNGRFSRPDYLRHLSISSGSLREAESHLHYLKRKRPGLSRIDEALELATTIAKLLAGLVRALQGKKEGRVP